jgi:ferritin
LKLIDDDLVSSLQIQLAHEKFNANLYLFIGGYLKNMGFNNLAKHFEGQHEEEESHAMMIYNLLTDLNAEVAILEIDNPSFPINTIKDIAIAYLNREIQTTESLDAIKKLAIDNNNPVVEEAMREMIKLQRHEYEEACDFSDKAEIVGSDWKWVMMWDLGL